MITLENYEEYIVMHADGELQPHEEEALQAFLNEYPHLRSELAVYEITRLEPDTAIVFTGKDALLKKEGGRKIGFIPGWRTFAAAAAVAALVVVAVVALKDEPKTNQQDVASTNTAQSAPAQAQSTPGETTTETPVSADTQQAVAQNNTAVAPVSAPQSVRVNKNVKTLTNTQRVAIAKVTTQRRKVEATPIAPQNLALQMSTMPLSALAQLGVDKARLKTATAIENIAIESEMNNTSEERSWIDKLPIDDVKKEKVAIAANAVSTGLDQVTAFRENLREKSLTIKVQQRKLILSF